MPMFIVQFRYELNSETKTLRIPVAADYPAYAIELCYKHLPDGAVILDTSCEPLDSELAPKIMLDIW